MITTHTRQLQQYTRSTNNNYTKDNLKLATKHTRQIRILQDIQNVKPRKQESTVYSFKQTCRTERLMFAACYGLARMNVLCAVYWILVGY